jgi:D-galactose 1-dehydrogenase
MKIALVGVGKVAREQHIPAITNSSNWELAATVSQDSAGADVENFNDLTTMLNARPDIPVVSFCTPALSRFALAAEAIKADRHVMLEKPPGATLSECRVLSSFARETRKALYATWHSREAAQVERAREWILGKTLRRARVSWKEDVRRWHPNQAWIWELSGLGVFDAGINSLSILTAILPAPFRLVSATLEFPANRQAPIGANLTFEHANGAEIGAVFDWRAVDEEIWTIEFETDEGQLILANGGARLFLDGSEQFDARPVRCEGEYDRLYAKMATYVAHCEIDMDVAPLRYVADAFLVGRRIVTSQFCD